MDAGACLSPGRFQLGGRLIHPLQFLEAEKLFLIKRLLVFEHEIDGTTQLVSKDREGFRFTVFTSKSFEVPFAGFVSLEEEDRSLGEGPLEMGVTDLFTTGTVFFAVGFFDAFNQAAVGDEILDRGEAADIMDLIEDDEAEDSSDTGDGTEAEVGIGVMSFGDEGDLVFETGKELVIIV